MSSRTSLGFLRPLFVTLVAAVAVGCSSPTGADTPDVAAAVTDASRDVVHDVTAPPIDARDAAMDAPIDTFLDAVPAPDARAPDASDDTATTADVFDAAPDAGPFRCTADDDCATRASAPLCDLASGQCVRCTEAHDLCPPTQHCVDTSHSCLPGCHDDTGCASGSDAGTPATYCDPAHHVCVACLGDAQCPSGTLCRGSACVPGCSADRACSGSLVCCDGACVDTQSNAANCGACTRACNVPNAAPRCSTAQCSIGTCTAPYADCDHGTADGCEVDTSSDVTNCGACGTTCSDRDHATATCVASRCGITCATGFGDCDGRLDNGCEVDLSATAGNCGACGHVCTSSGATAVCVDGACALGACLPNYGDCDGVASNGCETDLRASLNHCGTCDTACHDAAGSTAACRTGQCGFNCATNRGDCDGVASNGCETDLTNTVSSCGACNSVCAPPGSIGVCTSGVCSSGGCRSDAADCNRNAADGCETSLTGVNNCGACGVRCNVSGGTPSCATGTCAVGACNPGLGDCDHSAANGCETMLTLSITNCGTCGNACTPAHAQAACDHGVCAIALCASGYNDCNGDATDGCEATLDTTTNCGACRNACALPDAVPVCERNACAISACLPGFADCDLLPTDGCEVAITTLANCGGCGNVCAPAHTTGASCSTGTCDYAACAPGYSDCDGNRANGCEVALNAITSCGACDRDCTVLHATGACTSGTCGLGTCSAGFGNCDGTVSNGCEVPLVTVTNCGACGVACSPAHSTGGSCATGACDYAACTTGFADCDTSRANGCETNAKTLTNCGACGVACAPANATGATCAASTCNYGACTAGYGDCNGVRGDGCETPVNTSTNCGACGTTCSGGQSCVNGTCATRYANETCAAATPIVLSTAVVTVTGTTSGALNESGCGTGGDLWYSFTLAAREIVTIETNGSAYDTALALVQTCGTSLDCNDDAADTAGVSCGTFSMVTRVLEAGTYRFAVSGAAGAGGSFTVRLRHLSAGSGTNTVLARGTHVLTGSLTGSTGLSKGACDISPSNGPENAYYYTTCGSAPGGVFEFETCEDFLNAYATFDSVLYFRQTNGAEVCNDDSNYDFYCQPESSLNGTAAGGLDLRVLYVDGFGTGTRGSYSVSYVVP